jgi:hypothetical protein
VFQYAKVDIFIIQHALIIVNHVTAMGLINVILVSVNQAIISRMKATHVKASL